VSYACVVPRPAILSCDLSTTLGGPDFEKMLLQLWCILGVGFEVAVQSIQGSIIGAATVLLSAMLISAVSVLTVATAMAPSNSASMPCAAILGCQLILLVKYKAFLLVHGGHCYLDVKVHQEKL